MKPPRCQLLACKNTFIITKLSMRIERTHRLPRGLWLQRWCGLLQHVFKRCFFPLHLPGLFLLSLPLSRLCLLQQLHMEKSEPELDASSPKTQLNRCSCAFKHGVKGSCGESYAVEGQFNVSSIQCGGTLVWADDWSKVLKICVDFNWKTFVL